jgi:SPX domain protein involved in polyphosphate accumulation
MKGQYRHELKYSISYSDYLILRPRLKTIMEPDPHTDKVGSYFIQSVYFDNYTDKALKEKVDDVQKREKFRIRWYNGSKQAMTLEKKMKIDNLCMKFGIGITENQYDRIMNSDYDWMLETNNDLLLEFYYRLRQQRLKPSVIVSYTREPFIYQMGNVRITFDSNVKTSLARHDFNYESPLIPASEELIMEVKYDAYLPGVIQDVLQLGDIRQNAFSKYMTCRRYG